MTTLRGARVTLRPWRAGDLDEFAALNADPRVMEYFPQALTREQSAALLERMQSALESRGWGNWALDIGGACAGFTGLSAPAFDAHFTPCVEVGWRLASRFWGKGYATEAARLALAYGFDDLRLAEIVSFTNTENQRSRRVMERLSMHRDPADDFDHPRLPGHRLQPHVLYRLRRDNWRP